MDDVGLVGLGEGGWVVGSVWFVVIVGLEMVFGLEWIKGFGLMFGIGVVRDGVDMFVLRLGSCGIIVVVGIVGFVRVVGI